MSANEFERYDSDAELSLAAATAAGPGVLQAGARAPLFSLPDAEGRKIALEQLLRKGPVVLHFYRGSWCSYGEQSLAAFYSTYEKVSELGASAVAIGPDRASERPLHDPSVPDLYDQDARVASSYGLVFRLPTSLREKYQRAGYQPTSHGEWIVPLPAVYLLDRDGTVVMSSQEFDYRKTYHPEPLLQALRAIQGRKDRRLSGLF